jgi:hypothetical protein
MLWTASAIVVGIIVAGVVKAKLMKPKAVAMESSDDE